MKISGMPAFVPVALSSAVRMTIPYEFALRLAGAAFDFGRVVCLPPITALSINPGTDVMGTKPEV